MTTVFEFCRELRGSDLPPPARLVAFALASLADPETGAIPENRSPSYSEIARITGLSRSTTALQVRLLVDKSWLGREAPERLAAWRDKERNQYFVLVPTSPEGGLVRGPDVTDPPEPDVPTGPAPGLVRDEDQCKQDETGGTSPGAGLAFELTVRTTRTSKKTSRSTSTSSQPTRLAKVQDHREDVERLCTYLADVIEANGSKRPVVNDKWRQQCRLLLDEPRPHPVTEDGVKRAIDWIQKHPFWQGNILSMPKLRQHWDRLRIDATKEQRATGNGRSRGGWTGPYMNPENPEAAYANSGYHPEPPGEDHHDRSAA